MLRALRDNAQDDVSAIWFDKARAHGDARRFCERFAPGLVDRLLLHDGLVSLFDARGVEEAIDDALVDRVSLPSGGGIVIEGTEALTAIDVNSGRFVDGVNPFPGSPTPFDLGNTVYFKVRDNGPGQVDQYYSSFFAISNGTLDCDEINFLGFGTTLSDISGAEDQIKVKTF